MMNLKPSSTISIDYPISFQSTLYNILLGYIGNGFPNSPKEGFSFITKDQYNLNSFSINTSVDLTYYDSNMGVFYFIYGI